MSTMSQLVSDDQLLKFACRRRHRGEALSERNHLDPVRGELRAQLNGIPTVEGDLPDVELFRIRFNTFPNHVVIDHISGSCLNESLANPDIVRHTIFVDAAADVILGHPQPAENLPSFVFFFRWE